jgi:hypothetical protein
MKRRGPHGKRECVLLARKALLQQKILELRVQGLSGTGVNPAVGDYPSESGVRRRDNCTQLTIAGHPNSRTGATQMGAFSSISRRGLINPF